MIWPDTTDPMDVPLTISGGTPPYSLQLLSNGSGTSVAEVSTDTYEIIADASTSGWNFELYISSGISISTNEPHGGSQFGYICEDWIMKDVLAQLKLRVNDSDDGVVEIPFTLSCQNN